MGTKLDEAHQDLTHFAAVLRSRPVEVLDEAAKKKVYRTPPAPGESRKDRKQQKKQEKLYGGKEPLGASIGLPYVPPGARPKTPTPALVPPPSEKHPRGAMVPPGLPKTVKAAEPDKLVEPMKVVAPAAVAVKAAAIQAEPIEAPKTSPKPVSAAQPATPRQSLLSRIGKLAMPGLFGGKGKKAEQPASSQPSRFERLKGLVKHIAGLMGRKRLDSDVSISRTFAAMGLTEQRSSTTFKSCKDRAMLSTAHLRHSLPKPWFVKPTKDNPTYPVRTDCRASLAGVGRAIQKDMGNPDENVANQVIRRVNATTGGTRGRLNLKLWGTGRGGQRMETFRGKPGTPKRTDELAKKLGISRKDAAKLHGVSTGRPDNQKHTSPYSPPGGSKGPAGNREVTRHPLAHVKAPSKETGKKTMRQEKREAGKIGRGQARIGR